MKRRYRAIGNPTASQQRHQDAQRADGCAFCRMLGFSFRGLQDGSVAMRSDRDTPSHHGRPAREQARGQDHTVALGRRHHRGSLMMHLPTIPLMREKFGPSFQHHKRAFLEVIADNLGERSTAALQQFQDDRIARREAA